MSTELKNAVLSTDIKEQYDECAKKLLGHILVKSVEEFRGMNPEEVVHLIEGEPLISKVPVGSGFTNKIVGVDGKLELLNVIMIGISEKLSEKMRNMNCIDYWEHYCQRN